MTNQDLIKILLELPPESEVVIRDLHSKLTYPFIVALRRTPYDSDDCGAQYTYSIEEETTFYIDLKERNENF